MVEQRAVSNMNPQGVIHHAKRASPLRERLTYNFWPESEDAVVRDSTLEAVVTKYREYGRRDVIHDRVPL